MSVNRKELVRYLKDNGWSMVREGGRHSIVSKGAGQAKISVPRHRTIENILANEICKQAGLKPKY